MRKDSWIKSPLYDSIFVLAPPFVCLILIAVFPSFFISGQISEWTWFILVVGIDVGHVYSTIYRTYLDKAAIQSNKLLFYLSPVVLYVFGVILHSIHPLLFWRILAYFAVFHFIRQQYGFMRLYARHEVQSKWQTVDTIVIYATTIYPILYWHLKGPQLFNWFIENDFIYFKKPELLPVLNVIYLMILVAYVIKEIIQCSVQKGFNIPKNILILGTALSWYMGIVYFKGDLTFTLLNVVSHGIPYFALVWAYGNKVKTNSSGMLKMIFKPAYILLFLMFLLTLAYFEELLWDGLIWREHFLIFPSSFAMPDLSGSETMMTLLVPLLSLPQILHYFIDGFIWKIRNDKTGWVNFLLRQG